MDLAYNRAYVKAVEVAEKMNRSEMRFVCVKSNNNFTSCTIYSVQYDNDNNLFVVDDVGDRRPTSYSLIDKDTFFGFMKTRNMVKLED